MNVYSNNGNLKKILALIFPYVSLQRTKVLPALRDSCLLLCGTDENWNFSAVRSLIELKLGGDLGLVFQISMYVLISRFHYFLYCKQTKEQKNRGFTKLAFSPPFQVRLIWNLVGTSKQVLGMVWYVCFIYIIVCLHFVNVNKENTLYLFIWPSAGQICWNLVDFFT
jgi:hypothetical protein